MTRLKQPEELILTNALITLQAATDNQSSLEVYGITSAVVEEFSQKVTQAQNIEKAEQKMFELNNATASKNEVLKDCTNWGNQLRLRIELAFGKNSVQAKTFVSSKFRRAQTSENQMKNTLAVLLTLAQESNATLTNFGQTPEFIQQGNELLSSLVNVDRLQEQTKTEKRVLSEERHILFNEIYEMINRINKVGQMVFANDSAKLELFRSNWPKKSKTTPPPTEP